MYKSCSRETRDKAQLMASEKRVRNDLEEVDRKIDIGMIDR